MWFQLTNGVSITAPALAPLFCGSFPGFSIFPRRKNRQKSVPQESLEHIAAVKFGSPHAFWPLQSVILPTFLVTESYFSFCTSRFDRVRLKNYLKTFKQILKFYLFSALKLSVSFIKKNLLPISVSWPNCFRLKSRPMSDLP